MSAVLIMERTTAMNEFVLSLINIPLVAIEYAVFLVLVSGFFKSRRKYLVVVLVYIIILLTNYFTITFLAAYTLFKLLVSCVFLTLLAKVLFRTNVIYCAVLSVLYLSFVNVIDSLLLYFVAALSRTSMQQLLSNPYNYYLVAYSAKTLEVLVVTVLHAYAKRRFNRRVTNPQDYLRIVVFPVVSLLSTVVLLGAFLKFPDAAPYLLLCVVLLLLFDVAAIFLLSHFEQQQQIVFESRILQQELKLAQDSVAMLSASYSNERRLTHDFHNKLLAIQGLLSHDESGSEVRAYVDSLVDQEYMPSLPVSTHRPVADVVLNLKYQIAQQEQIPFQVQLDDLSNFPLPDDALVVVLSNLLDNAIEACKKLPNPAEGTILVKAKTSPEESILYIENTTDGPVKIVDNRIPTSKVDASRHGYGLQNTFSLIEKNGGVCTIHYEYSKFSCVVLFSHI